MLCLSDFMLYIVMNSKKVTNLCLFSVPLTQQNPVQCSIHTQLKHAVFTLSPRCYTHAVKHAVKARCYTHAVKHAVKARCYTHVLPHTVLRTELQQQGYSNRATATEQQPQPQLQQATAPATELTECGHDLFYYMSMIFVVSYLQFKFIANISLQQPL